MLILMSVASGEFAQEILSVKILLETIAVIVKLVFKGHFVKISMSVPLLADVM